MDATVYFPVWGPTGLLSLRSMIGGGSAYRAADSALADFECQDCPRALDESGPDLGHLQHA